MTRRVLVTGATGFIGGHLARALIEHGWSVEGLSRSAIPHLTGDVKWHRLPSTARELAPALGGLDAVIHLAAAVAGSRSSPVTDTELVDGNVRTGAVILEAMRMAGTRRLINASTVWKYRNGHRLEPANRYAATKIAFEVLIGHAVAADGLEATTLELADTYGPKDHRPKLIPLLLDAARLNAPIALGSRNQPIAPVHIDDVVRGFIEVIEPVVTGGHIDGSNVGHVRCALLPRASMTVEDVVETVHEVTGGRPAVSFESLAPVAAGPTRLGSPHPAPPGWRPRIGLHDGIASLWREIAP